MNTKTKCRPFGRGQGIARWQILAVTLALVFALAGAATAFALVSDSGDLNVQVPNDTECASGSTTAGALVDYIGDSCTSLGSSGTGVFDSFVRLQASPTEQGYNTNGTVEFDTKTGSWTHAIKVSDIPVVSGPGGKLYWELFADINENNKTPKISLNDLEVYFTKDPNLTGYPFTGNADEQYGFSGNILINDVNQGSGRADLRYRIPLDNITIPNQCGYKNPACDTYFVLYTQWGTTGGDYASDGGFEEWKVKQYPYVTVSKTANTSFTETYKWDIAKKVDNTKLNIADGSSATFNYTVDVTHDNGTPSDWAVDGKITINNPGTLDAVINSASDVSDNVSGAGTATVDCGVTFPYTIPAGGTLTCSYSKALTSGTNTTNTATVTLAEGTVFTGSAAVTFGDPTTVKDGSVTVVDDKTDPKNPVTLGTVSYTDTSPKEFTYSLSKSGVAGTCTDYNNTATFTTNTTSTTGSDSEKVTVCVGKDLTVSKNATPTFTRTFKWGITKDVDNTKVTINNGQSATFNYTIDVTHDSGTDSAWKATGTITVNNPNDWEDIDANVTDAVDNGGSCSVASGTGATIPKSSSKSFTYECTWTSAPSSASGTNTATASWNKTTYSTPTGSASGTAAFTFATPTTVVDDSVTVTDSFKGSLGAVSSSDSSPKSFTYSRTITPSDYGSQCGTYTYDNTATFKTNTTSTTGSDSKTVTVVVQCVGDTFPTNTTCSAFNDGTATPLNTINYSVSGGTITQNVTPGVFFYWSKFTTTGGNLSIVETSNPPGYLFKVASWAKLYDSNCNFVKDLTIGSNGVDVSGSVGSGTFIVGVKYDSKSIVGLPAPSPTTVDYAFKTYVGTALVDQAAPPDLMLIKNP